MNQQLARVDALLAETDEIFRRTRAVVARLSPPIPAAPHGFYDPAGFVQSSIAFGQRERLFAEVQRRVTVKVRARNQRTKR